MGTDLISEPWSLQQRLRNRLWVAITVLWLIGSALALYVQRQKTNQLLDREQLEMAHLALNLPAGPMQTPGSLLPDVDDRVAIQVFDQHRRLVWKSPKAPARPLATIWRNQVQVSDERRLVVQHDALSGRTAIVSTSLRDREEALLAAAEALLLPLLALLPLTALTLTWLLRQAFAPLQSMRQTLREREAHELSPLDSHGLPQELKPLVDGLNQLFERVSRARQAESAFAANSAHELRTPIAAAQAQLQRMSHELQQQADPAALALRVDTLGRQLDRLQHLCIKLMQLSRAESGVATRAERIDLVTVTHLVMDEFDRPEQTGRLHLEIEDQAETIEAWGDMDALAIALRNLIENALVHGGQDTPVTIGITKAPAIDVIDQGVGVPSHRLDTLRQPFQRGESPSPGHGLGLSIANSIARQMGGSLLLNSPHTNGRGLHARLALRAPPAPLTP